MSAKSCRTLPRATLGSKQTCNTLRARATPPAAKRQFTVQAGISVGDKAPDFTLPDQNGKSVKLSKYQGIFGKKVVLYFYGSDGSPSCTKQAEGFTEAYTAFKKAGAEVIGVSSDSPDTHKDFASELGIPFKLLSDEDDEVREEYGISKDFLFLKGRETYVINKQGVVEFVFNNQFSTDQHIEQTLDLLDANVEA